MFFDRHRGLAMGMAMAGSGAGGLVFAPATQSLIHRFGAPVTLRILGVWNLVVCIPIAFVIRRHPGYNPVRPSLELATKGTFVLQVRSSATHIRSQRAHLQICSCSRHSFRLQEISFRYTI
jgi:hypothetical protein